MLKQQTNFDFDKMSKKHICEYLDEKGVPPEINAQLAAVAIGRYKERQLLRNITEKIIPIQQMPKGAVPVYDKEE